VSRSYRKPIRPLRGTKSAHADKKVAARGLRRSQNQWLYTLKDLEGGLIPHRLECAFNNTYDFMYRYWLKLHRK
jgi:hypothetical protein